ncbi:MAG: hypothetical protein ACE5JG_09410, partial [Planctomycetota bacterium]
MGRAAHRRLALLAGAAALLCLFQAWVLHLDPDAAASLVLCRFPSTALFDCYRSLYLGTAELLGARVVFLILGFALFQLGLAVYAWLAEPGARPVLLAWAGAAALPLAVLSLYQVAHDLITTELTSVSALLQLGAAAP